MDKDKREEKYFASGSSTADALSSSSESEADVQKIFETKKDIDDKCRSAEAEAAGYPEEPRARSAPPSADVSRVYVHRIRGTAHFGKQDDVTKLACGRALTDAFDQGSSQDQHWPRCHVCMPEAGDLIYDQMRGRIDTYLFFR